MTLAYKYITRAGDINAVMLQDLSFNIHDIN